MAHGLAIAAALLLSATCATELGAPRLRTILATPIVLLLPGLALARLAPRRDTSGPRPDLGAHIGRALALSLAMWPLLVLWLPRLGVPWDRGSIAAAIGLFALVAAWPREGRGLPRIGRPRGPRTDPDPGAAPLPPGSRGSRPRLDRLDLALLALFALGLSVRLLRILPLAAPPWVDGVNHALVVELILRTGGFPATYTPFEGIGPASYHSGFHAGAATFVLLSGATLPRALLIYGELLNAGVVFAAWLLTMALLRNGGLSRHGRRSAALVAALVAGLVAPMPAGYTLWGRYTQLAGLLLLPGLIELWVRGARASTQTSGQGRRWRRRGPRTSTVVVGARARQSESAQSAMVQGSSAAHGLASTLLGAILLAGLSLVHYRVTLFAACLVLAWLLAHLSRPLLDSAAAQLLRPAIPATLGAALLAAPWFAPRLAPVFAPRVALWTGTDEGAFYDFDWSYLLGGNGWIVLVLSIAAGLLALRSAPRLAATLFGWVTLLFTLANVRALGLPGHGFIGNQAVEIALFLPQAVIIGWLAARIVDRLRGPGGLLPRSAFDRWALGLGLVAALSGATVLARDAGDATILAKRADLAAMSIVERLVPPGATVAVNPAPWGKYQYVGIDGGAWIPVLTGRATMPPPQIYALADLPYIQAANDGAEAIRAHAGKPSDLAVALRERGIGYVYVGERGGVLRPDLLLESERFALLHRGAEESMGTWLFEVQDAVVETRP